jgi:protein SHQ1
MIWTLK